MYKTGSTRERWSLFLKLFIPILIYQFANFSASFIDTMMTGRFSTTDLAGVSMATSLWNPLFSFLTGIVSALIPMVGQELGKGDKEKVRTIFHSFIYIGIGLSIFFLTCLLFLARPFLANLQLETAVRQVAETYLFYMAFGLPPFLLFSICRSFFDSIGLTKLSMYLMLLLVPLNSLFNYLLIYGKMGLPALGGAGAGLGTSLAYWCLLIIILLVTKFHSTIQSFSIWKWTPIHKKWMKEGLRIGLPIGLQVFAEVAIFAVVGLYMSNYSSLTIAAHQAAMNFATLLYAFPLSVSMTLPIVISYEIGASDGESVRSYTRIGRLTALLFACLTLSFLYFNRQWVASLYGQEAAFIQLTANFLTFALFFQLADAFTAPIQGILRGYKDTSVPFVLGLVSYWSITFPLAWFLDAWLKLGPKAFWIGLITGIFCCGISLSLRLKWIQKESGL
ncbi:TPA: MATE family efflux transporter [Streptococcus suis]